MPERDLGPLPVPPPPPPEASGVPAEPRTALDAGAATRLLDLVRRARSAVARAITGGKETGASPAARETARRAGACMDDLVRLIPDLDRALDTLEATAAGSPASDGNLRHLPSGTSLDLRQITAIETFIGCAEPLLREEQRASPALTVAAGVGLPLFLSIGLSLLSP